jgi:hypothetical protein
MNRFSPAVADRQARFNEKVVSFCPRQTNMKKTQEIVSCCHKLTSLTINRLNPKLQTVNPDKTDRLSPVAEA